MSEYEFKQDENEVINKFRQRMLLFSFVLMIAGLLTILAAALDDFNRAMKLDPDDGP